MQALGSPPSPRASAPTSGFLTKLLSLLLPLFLVALCLSLKKKATRVLVVRAISIERQAGDRGVSRPPHWCCECACVRAAKMAAVVGGRAGSFRSSSSAGMSSGYGAPAAALGITNDSGADTRAGVDEDDGQNLW